MERNDTIVSSIYSDYKTGVMVAGSRLFEVIFGIPDLYKILRMNLIVVKPV